MGHGALDAIDTPPLAGHPRAAAGPFLAKLDAVERVLRDRDPRPPDASAPQRAAAPATFGLVALGASAGGPSAVLTVLRGLPSGFPAAIVVVQHVDQRFAAGMAQWLHQNSPLPVRLAQEGDVPARGTVLLAGTDDHLVFKDPGRLGYSPEPRELIYRPSVDMLFQSACRHWPGELVGVLLTGMGRDGALGLKALRERGAYTIAQDRATSAVYGMPKAAAELGAAVDVLPIHHIAPQLAAHFSKSGGNQHV
jgi:chemotaxis response regulator CheB